MLAYWAAVSSSPAQHILNVSEIASAMSANKKSNTMAFGDESILLSTNPPLYLLGASILGGDESSATKKLEQAKPKNASKLHWRNMSDRQKADSLAIISNIDHQTVLVEAAPLKGIKQERARRKCLETILIELESRNIVQLLLESRQDRLDKRDKDCLLYARRAKAISTIDVAHSRGSDDARLWLPDQILGAYGENKKANADTRWLEHWEQIRDKIEVLKISL